MRIINYLGSCRFSFRPVLMIKSSRGKERSLSSRLGPNLLLLLSLRVKELSLSSRLGPNLLLLLSLRVKELSLSVASWAKSAAAVSTCKGAVSVVASWAKSASTAISAWEGAFSFHLCIEPTAIPISTCKGAVSVIASWVNLLPLLSLRGKAPSLPLGVGTYRHRLLLSRLGPNLPPPPSLRGKKPSPPSALEPTFTTHRVLCQICHRRLHHHRVLSKSLCSIWYILIYIIICYCAKSSLSRSITKTASVEIYFYYLYSSNRCSKIYL